MKTAIITGITGQDGSYMAEYLLKEGLIVYGTHRRTVKPYFKNVDHLRADPYFNLVEMDITDPHSVSKVVENIQPDYFINFAANSFVGNSWNMPRNHMETNCMGVLNCLEAVRNHKSDCRFYNAGSSEQFGNVMYSPQDEKHPFMPRSPYGAAKCAAHHLVKVYRESYNLYAVQGILFNHESERRGDEFVTQKIAREAVRIKKALDSGVDFDPMELGNLDAKRDWSHAEDFVGGVWRMLNQEKYWGSATLSIIPKEKQHEHISDYVLASGETHTVREFAELAFARLGINGVWDGSGLDETFVTFHEDGNPVKTLLKINKDFYRPAEVELLLGCASKVKKELGWSLKVSFKSLVERMVDNQIRS